MKLEDMKKPENDTDGSASFPFVNIKPGGNDTALFIGIPDSTDQRKELNSVIQHIYSNIEQVGFVNLDPAHAELMMAGGEFCGNATRSTAWKVLDGQPGTIEIKVSSVANPLRAGVTAEGEAFAQMPIYSDPQNITEDPDKKGNYTVQMEGITHYLDFNIEQLDGLSPEDIKQKSFEALKTRGLTEGPAAGIIYVKKTAEGYEITPVVYVRDIDTLFLETACGSGTTALGLALALQSGQSVSEAPVRQPSGLDIKISVDYDGEKFGYAQIQGPVTELNRGTLEVGKNQTYVVEEVTNAEQLAAALQQEGLPELYKDVFGKPPYNESFTDDEIAEIFEQYLQHGKLFLAKDTGRVIGFGASVPLVQEPVIEEILHDKLDTSVTWYMADLGVNEEYRKNGIGKMLVQKRIDAAPDGSILVMRTSINNLASQSIYKSLGFVQVSDAYQFVEQARQDGSTATDKRLFLARAKNK